MQIAWSRLTTRASGQLVLLVLVLVLGGLVRIAQFSHVPPGFNQDEAASAYEAYSLAETGQDKWGNPRPAYFPAWGSGQNVLLAYLTVPVINTMGMSVFSARLVPLVLGVLTLPLFFFSLRPLGFFPALLGTLLLALAPWHFMLSRWALESNLVPFFMLLGCVGLARALITGRRRWIAPCLLPFALSLYAYGTTAVVLPGLFGLVLLLGFGRGRARWGSWLLALGLFGLVAAPFGLFFAENYVVARNFAWTDKLFFATPLLPATRISQVSGTHWTDVVAYNWNFLLAGFDDGTCYNLMPGYKLLLSLPLPFALVGALVGAAKLVGRRGRVFSSPPGIVLGIFGAWGLASLSLFCTVELNVNRFNHFYLPCLALAAWIISLIINSFNASVPRPALRLAVVAWVLLEGGLAVNHYFTDYRDGPIKGQFNDGLAEAFAAVGKLRGSGQVRITEQMPLPYVYALFYLRYPPAQFQREAQVAVSGGTYQVRRFGRYVFTPDELLPGCAYGYLSRKNEYGTLPRQVLFTNEAWEVGVVQPAAVAGP